MVKKLVQLKWDSKKDVEKFSGQWIAVSGNRIIANGHDVVKVSKEAKKKQKALKIKELPALTRVSEKDEVLIL